MNEDKKPDFHVPGESKEFYSGGLMSDKAWLAPSNVGSSVFNDAYTAYTPVWTSDGTAPALGNATVTAVYKKVGRFVHYIGKVVMGSSSTYGTGSYSFSLPYTQSTNQLTVALGGIAYLFDSSATAYMLATPLLTAANKFIITYPATYGGTYTGAGQLAPWTWATSDQITWNITYEAAS